MIRFLEKLVFGNSNNNNYQDAPVDETIDRIVERICIEKENGHKIGFFIGRTPDQPLPQEKGWIWYSLDINLEVTEDTVTLEDQAKISHGHHILANFNKREPMQKLENLANRVIVDGSTFKSIHSPWRTLLPLLAKGSDSDLIAEISLRVFTEFRDLKTPTKYSPEVITVEINGLDIALVDAQNNLQRFRTTLIEKTNEYLKGHFEEVQIRNDTPPYDDLMHFKFGQYWYLRTPI